MVVREVALEVAEILGDKDAEKTINKNGPLTDDENKVITKYINGLNIAVDTIASRYYTSVRETRVTADNENRIDYDKLASRVYEIISVKNALNGQGVDYYTLPFCLYVPSGGRDYLVKFKFLPEKCLNLDDNIELLPFVSSRALVYLMVSDMLLSKALYDESRFWFNKFESIMTEAVTNRRMRTLKVGRMF